MKKYEMPEVQVEKFYVMDILTVSGDEFTDPEYGENQTPKG